MTTGVESEVPELAPSCQPLSGGHGSAGLTTLLSTRPTHECPRCSFCYRNVGFVKRQRNNRPPLRHSGDHPAKAAQPPIRAHMQPERLAKYAHTPRKYDVESLSHTSRLEPNNFPRESTSIPSQLLSQLNPNRARSEILAADPQRPTHTSKSPSLR